MNRRNFLNGGVAAAVSPVLAPLAAIAIEPRVMPTVAPVILSSPLRIDTEVVGASVHYRFVYSTWITGSQRTHNAEHEMMLSYRQDEVAE